MEESTMDEQGCSQSSAGPANESAETQHPAEPAERSLNDLRLQRIEQYQREALENLSAEQAVVAAANGGLHQLAMQLEQAIQKSLVGQSDSPQRFERVGSTIEIHLKVLRQADRLSRYLLDLRNEPDKLAQRRDEAARRAKKAIFDTHETVGNGDQR
jgi:hypothetical protein